MFTEASPAPRGYKLGVPGRHEESQGLGVGSQNRSEPCHSSRLEGGAPRHPRAPQRTLSPLPTTRPRAGSYPRTGRGGASAGASSRRGAECSGPRGSRASSGRLEGVALRLCGGEAGLGAGGEQGAARPTGKRRDCRAAAAPASPRKRTGTRLPAFYFIYLFFKGYSFFPLLPSLRGL